MIVTRRRICPEKYKSNHIITSYKSYQLITEITFCLVAQENEIIWQCIVENFTVIMRESLRSSRNWWKLIENRTGIFNYMMMYEIWFIMYKYNYKVWRMLCAVWVMYAACFTMYAICCLLYTAGHTVWH